MEKNIYNFVLDCSIIMTWCFEDESNDDADSILENLKIAPAIVPVIWPLEVSNVLLQSQKNKRITAVQSANFIDVFIGIAHCCRSIYHIEGYA